MKYTINFTTSSADVERFQSAGELSQLLQGFDGVELMYFGEDEKQLLPPGRVLGLHMNSHNHWLDFWNRDEAALIREYDDLDTCRACFGGTLDPELLVTEFRRDHALAKRFGARYMVYHVSDCALEECFTYRFRHTDEEVIDAACDLINQATAGMDSEVALLLENLWLPGLRFTDPALTARLLNGIRYPNKGLMLDTGHLLHTRLDLETQAEGVAYIHSLLDAHGDLRQAIRGVHLNQSLTGAYCRQVMAAPPSLGSTYAQRSTSMFYHAFAVDQHRPFTDPGVKGLLERIDPEFCTFEFITEDLTQHKRFLQEQREALGLPRYD